MKLNVQTSVAGGGGASDLGSFVEAWKNPQTIKTAMVRPAPARSHGGILSRIEGRHTSLATTSKEAQNRPRKTTSLKSIGSGGTRKPQKLIAAAISMATAATGSVDFPLLLRTPAAESSMKTNANPQTILRVEGVSFMPLYSVHGLLWKAPWGLAHTGRRRAARRPFVLPPGFGVRQSPAALVSPNRAITSGHFSTDSRRNLSPSSHRLCS